MCDRPFWISEMKETFAFSAVHVSGKWPYQLSKTKNQEQLSVTKIAFWSSTNRCTTCTWFSLPVPLAQQNRKKSLVLLVRLAKVLSNFMFPNLYTLGLLWNLCGWSGTWDIYLTYNGPWFPWLVDPVYRHDWLDRGRADARKLFSTRAPLRASKGCENSNHSDKVDGLVQWPWKLSQIHPKTDSHTYSTVDTRRVHFRSCFPTRGFESFRQNKDCHVPQ